MKKLFVLLAATATLTGCMSSKVQVENRDARSLEPQMNAFVSPVLADVNVSGNRIEKTETVKLENAFGTSFDVFISNIKANMIAKMLQEVKADVLVGTQSAVFTEDTKTGYVKVTITGYPGKYTNWRPTTKDHEINWIRGAYTDVKIITSDFEKTKAVH